MIELINKHKRQYTDSTIQDIIKLLYQSILGNNHLINNENMVYERIKEECLLSEYKQYKVEDIGKEYVRLHLFKAEEADIKTITQLFLLSAKEQLDYNELIKQLNILKTQEPIYTQYIEDYINKGCPMMSHSNLYRTTYHPHYRIIKKEYIKYYDIFKKINECILNNKDIIIGIDGMCGSGKSTLASLLDKVFDIQIFHMDDFFLQLYQRSEERYKIPGENIDHERFLKEVLIPLKNKEDIVYRRFNCYKMEIEEHSEIKPYKPINIIEGSYCLHPELRTYIDYSVVLTINKDIQLKRLKERNNDIMYKRFINEWIPLETLYFNYYNIADSCNLLIKNEEE